MAAESGSSGPASFRRASLPSRSPKPLQQEIGLHQLAAHAGIDRANLRAVTSGRRTPSPAMLTRLETVIREP